MQPQSQSSFALNMLRCGKRDKSQKRQCYSFIHIIHYLLPIFSQIFAYKLLAYTGCSLNIVFFQRILESLPPLPRQHSAAIGCTNNYQPIGVTVHSHFVESFEGFLQRCRRGRGCNELWKNTIFPEHSVHSWSNIRTQWVISSTQEVVCLRAKLAFRHLQFMNARKGKMVENRNNRTNTEHLTLHLTDFITALIPALKPSCVKLILCILWADFQKILVIICVNDLFSFSLPP